MTLIKTDLKEEVLNDILELDKLEMLSIDIEGFSKGKVAKFMKEMEKRNVEVIF